MTVDKARGTREADRVHVHASATAPMNVAQIMARQRSVVLLLAPSSLLPPPCSGGTRDALADIEIALDAGAALCWPAPLS